jgi:CDP-glucose 4,6-dehydratase
MTDLSFYKGKNVFITGHTGFKGSWLCHVLLYANANIAGYALEPPTSPSLFVQTNLGKKVRSVTGDIRDRAKLISAVREIKPDIVFHLAAQPLVRLAYREPVQTYETNVMGTVNILEAIRVTSSVHSFVNVTTDKVYENKEWHWGYRENENLCGFDPYSNSKSCSELVTYSYRNSFFCKENLSAISTARAGNVIGGGDYAQDRVIPDCVRSAMTGREINIRNPYSVRPYQHVLECLSGYLLLAEKQYNDKKFEGSYNFGPDEESCVTTSRLVELFCELWGQDVYWITGTNAHQPHEANLLKLDCSKAKMILGWKQYWDIRTTLEKVVVFSRASTREDKIMCIEKQIRERFG